MACVKCICISIFLPGSKRRRTLDTKDASSSYYKHRLPVGTCPRSGSPPRPVNWGRNQSSNLGLQIGAWRMRLIVKACSQHMLAGWTSLETWHCHWSLLDIGLFILKQLELSCIVLISSFAVFFWLSSRSPVS